MESVDCWPLAIIPFDQSFVGPPMGIAVVLIDNVIPIW